MCTYTNNLNVGFVTFVPFTSAMHHALEIQEILLNIVGRCDPRTLVYPVGTCRAFEEPALDVLWMIFTLSHHTSQTYFMEYPKLHWRYYRCVPCQTRYFLNVTSSASTPVSFHETKGVNAREKRYSTDDCCAPLHRLHWSCGRSTKMSNVFWAAGYGVWSGFDGGEGW